MDKSKISYITIIVISALIHNGVAQAFELDQCKVIDTIKSRIKEDQAQFQKISALYQAKLDAHSIRERLPELLNDQQTLTLADRLETDKDINNTILLLADALDRSAMERHEDSIELIPIEAISLGSLILSSYLIRHINKDQKGIRAIFAAQFKSGSTGKMKYARYGLNMSFLGGLIGSLYLAHRTYKNSVTASELRDIMKQLEDVSIDAEKILTLRNQIEEDIVRVEQLEWSDGAACQ